MTKDLYYAMLSGPRPPGEEAPAISSLCSSMVEVKRFFVWLEHHFNARGEPLPALAELTQADLAGYQRHLVNDLANSSHLPFALAVVRYFWRWRQVLPSDRLAFDPLRDIDTWSSPRSQREENKTPRIPEQVLGPLLVWSLRFIDVFAPDILAAHHLWTAMRDPDRVTLDAAEGARALHQLLDDHVTRGRPLPGGRNGQVNIKFLADTLRCHRRQIYNHLDAIKQTAEIVGIGDRSCFDVPVTATLGGNLWVKAITTEHTEPELAGHPCPDASGRLLHRGCVPIRNARQRGQAPPPQLPAHRDRP